VNSCLGDNFSTGSGNPSDGTQTTAITQPTPGGGIVYQVVCSHPTYTPSPVSDSIAITKAAPMGAPELNSTPSRIKPNGQTTLVGNTGGGTGCTLTGTNGFSTVPTIAGDGSFSVNPGALTSTTVFTLTCSNGSVNTTVLVQEFMHF
jgi:hypothetical protein